MRHLRPSRLSCAALALTLAACGERPDSAPSRAATSDTSSRGVDTTAGAATAAAPPLRAASNAGTFVAEVTPLGGAVPMNAHFAVELALFEPDGTTPFDPEEVTLDARMEEHEHGMLRDVVLARVGAGRWRAEGLLFHMVGVWQFQVDVRQGARVERAQMDLTLR